MKTHIRILTLLLAFCLLLPAAALPALGQEDETSGQPQTTEEVVLRVAPHPGGSVTVTGALAEPELETDGTYAYRFAAGSAFIDRGAPTETVRGDGFAREPIPYNGSAPDLGAYEYNQ